MDLPPQLPQPPGLPPALPVFSPEERRDLARAKALLEHPGLAARLAGVLGRPIEKGFQMLPKGWAATVQKAARAALWKALALAVSTLGTKSGTRRASEKWHKVLVGASGGLGGVFGLASLPVELPVSTTLMLRSIADIARSEGHDLKSPATKLACLEVFALGGRQPDDDAAESTYWVVRATLARAVSEAAAYLAEKTVIEETAPALLRFVTTVAGRFGVVVSEEVAAKAVPVVGAAGGAAINVLFLDHFQDMARGHFIVKRLEDRHGLEAVRAAYGEVVVREA